MTDELPSVRPVDRPVDAAGVPPMVQNVPSGAPARLPAGEVARRSFGTVRRGFDPEEVRSFLEVVARQLEAAEHRERELIEELTAAEDRARHPKIDEAVLTAALGQRSASILRAAHEEAARITQQAEAAAATLLRDAQQHATDAQVNAESTAAERVAEAELEANAVRQQTREEAAATVAAARAEGESLIERARDHGRSMLDQAQEARRRVLADTAQRRRMVTDQIEQFRAARDEVAGSVVGVRRSLERILEDLARADDEARAAANAARPHRGAAPEAVLVEEAERAAAEIGADSGSAIAHLADSSDALLHIASPAPRHAEPAVPAEPAPEPAGSATGASDGPSAAVDSPTEPGGDVSVPPGGPDLPPVDVVVAGAETAWLGEAGVSHVAGGAGEPAARAPGSATDVDDLFARLRARDERDEAGRAVPAPAARDAVPGGGGDVPEGTRDDGWTTGATAVPGATPSARPDAQEHAAADAPGEPGVAADRRDAADEPTAEVVLSGAAETPEAAAEDAPSDDELALAERAAAVEPIATTLSRKLKRALQDDQNRILDVLRKGTGEWRDELVSDDSSQRALYADAAAAPVRDCVAAGIAFARTRLGRRPGRAPAPDAQAVGRISGELAASVVTLLRRRLEGDDVVDAAERIGAAYREWRGERIERLAHDVVVDAFDAGVLAGSAKSPAVRWVRSGDGPGCADCEDNALTGALRPGEAFPTGHHHPPAHAGCRCLLVPTPT